MTELQTLRKTLMEAVKKIEDKEVDERDVNMLVNVSNSVIKSYNVELRADEASVKSGELSEHSVQNMVFKEIP